VFIGRRKCAIGRFAIAHLVTSLLHSDPHVGHPRCDSIVLKARRHDFGARDAYLF
jgi:hypothetical protein